MTFIKNILFYSILLLFINFNQLSYAEDMQEDKTRSSITSPTNSQSDSNHDQEFLNFIEDTFQSVVEQTQTIEFSLQQIELILNAGQIKFNHTKISKSQLLAEIKDIKSIIQTIFQFYTTNMEKGEAILVGTCFNTAFINHLLPIITKNVHDLNVENFDKSVSQDFENIKNSLQDLEQIPLMIKDNNDRLQLLAQASDTIGLTLFNKIYRYLDTNTLPFYGKSTIEAVKDVAYWGSISFIVYTLAIYFTKRDLPIYWTSKKYTPEADSATLELEKQMKSDEFNNLSESEKTIITKQLKELHQSKKGPTTWKGVDGQTYTYQTAEDFFPLKKLLGDFRETKRAPLKPDENDVKKLENKFGIFSHMHDAALAASDPFISFPCGFLYSQTRGHFQELYKKMKKQFNESIEYYFKGNINLGKNSNTIPKTYFKDMIGGEDLEKLARELTDYLKNPTRYERAGITPSVGYLLVGPAQTGKSFFAKALKTMIDEEFSDETDKVKFFSITADDVKYFDGFARIFNIARRDAPCILFIDELDLHGARRDRDARITQELLTSINGIETDQSKKVIVIAATNKPEELDFALKQKGRLGTIITFDYPTYECRKAYLEKQLQKKNIMLSDEMIDTIAQETDGHTYNMIDDIIRQALQLATYQTRPVTEADFEVTLDREIRKIKPNTTISVAEKELVAMYQAGQAAARHILNTDQQIVKITIDAVDKPIKSKEGFGVINENKGHQHENIELLPANRIKPTRLGFVFTMSKINNHELLSDLEQEKELMALLAGQAALELIKGTTYHEFGKEDRAKVLEAFEKKISQGTPITDVIRLQAIAQKEALYQKVKNVLKNHTEFIQTIVDQLLQCTTINKKQWQSLTADYPVVTSEK